MAINQTIGAISTAPQLGVDSKEVFVQKAETVWAELKARVSELNTAFGQINTTETNINNKEASVVAKEALINPHYNAIDTINANIGKINQVVDIVVPNINAILELDTTVLTITRRVKMEHFGLSL